MKPGTARVARRTSRPPAPRLPADLQQDYGPPRVMRVVGIEYEDQYGNCSPLDPSEATNMANLHAPDMSADNSRGSSQFRGNPTVPLKCSPCHSRTIPVDCLSCSRPSLMQSLHSNTVLVYGLENTGSAEQDHPAVMGQCHPLLPAHSRPPPGSLHSGVSWLQTAAGPCGRSVAQLVEPAGIKAARAAGSTPRHVPGSIAQHARRGRELSSASAPRNHLANPHRQALGSRGPLQRAFRRHEGDGWQ